MKQFKDALDKSLERGDDVLYTSAHYGGGYDIRIGVFLNTKEDNEKLCIILSDKNKKVERNSLNVFKLAK